MSIDKELSKIVTKVTKDLKLSDNALMIAGEHLEELKYVRLATPSTELNQALYGGIIEGAATELAGAESSGKTSLALQIIGLHHQKAISNGSFYNVAWYDTEGDFDMDHATRLGVDPDQIVVITQQEVVAEKGLDITLALAKSGKFRMIVINSLAGLLPMAEEESELEKANMAV